MLVEIELQLLLPKCLLILKSDALLVFGLAALSVPRLSSTS